MKLSFLALLCALALNAQKHLLPCDESVSYENRQGDFTLWHNGAATVLPLSDFAFEGFTASISTSCLHDAIDITVQQQNGNDYVTDHYIFRKRNGQYRLDRRYTITSGRNDYTVSGTIGNQSGIKDLPRRTDEIMEELYSLEGFQEDKEKEVVPYMANLQKAYKARKWNTVLLLTDFFMLKELGILTEYGAAELNDIAYYAYRAHGLEQATLILETVVTMAPSRAVAFLNLADCYWDAGKQEKALIGYAKYLELMLQNKKQHKVPAYVRKRLSEKI